MAKKTSPRQQTLPLEHTYEGVTALIARTPLGVFTLAMSGPPRALVGLPDDVRESAEGRSEQIPLPRPHGLYLYEGKVTVSSARGEESRLWEGSTRMADFEDVRSVGVRVADPRGGFYAPPELEKMEDVKNEYILHMIRKYGDNRKLAAARLGVSYKMLASRVGRRFVMEAKAAGKPVKGEKLIGKRTWVAREGMKPKGRPKKADPAPPVKGKKAASTKAPKG